MQTSGVCGPSANLGAPTNKFIMSETFPNRESHIENNPEEEKTFDAIKCFVNPNNTNDVFPIETLEKDGAKVYKLVGRINDSYTATAGRAEQGPDFIMTVKPQESEPFYTSDGREIRKMYPDFRVIDMALTFGDKKFTLENFGVDEKGFLITPDPASKHNGRYDFEKGEIEIDSLSCVEDIATLLHEVGHMEDLRKNKMVPEDTGHCVENASQISPEEIVFIKQTAIRERAAWANAIKKMRKLGLSTKDLGEKQQEKSLKSYDKHAISLGEHATVEHFSSSEERAKIRKKR